MNLDTTKTKDVKRYLREFLMDERVIDIAYLPLKPWEEWTQTST